MQSLDLIVHLLEWDVLTTLTEVLAVEVTDEVPDDRCVVVHPVIARRRQRTIPVGSEVDVAASILSPPVAFEALPVLDEPSVSLLPVGTYL